MAHLIPPTNIDDIGVKSERDVARSLVERLPSDCTIYHSFPWLRLERNEYRPENQVLQEGEADFLIIWPDRGILVLEVKGGKIRFDHDTMEWYSTNYYGKEFQIKDPFKQASKNLHAIEAIIKKKVFSNQPLPFAYGYAVCFPDLVYKGGSAPGSDPNIVIDLSDFLTNSSFSDSIANALNKWNRTASPRPITKEDKRQIERAISPEFKLVALMSRQIANQEEQLVRLTDEQHRVLEFCQHNKRVAIEGVAGSGKTLLALSQARFYAEQGLSTLLLCYNKALANWLRENIPDELNELIQVNHFHGLVAELCRQCGQAFNPKNSAEFWSVEAADLLSNALAALPGFRFDALVVDEAQDFLPEWWLVLDELNRDGSEGPLFVFYDHRQVLFQPKECIPDMEFGGSLPTNCRNTCEISKKCGEIISEDIKNHPLAPQGEKLELVINPSTLMLGQVIEAKLKDLLLNQGLDPSQIAILSPYKKAEPLTKIKAINKLTLSDDLATWRKNQCILHTTIRSFKGLEADVVILVLPGKPSDDSLFTKADYYVACSRAKHVLAVFSQSAL
ncbi:nuclease-related domain-containing DEAD/DEAH box helicase [Teredinibacter turnerae]|uniref:nuclease-related domain-containing DEAD/DEAH box helicase n=1 Tax=Teredinibacter turnerae TaxID=2426 RepID=UPI0030D24EF3